MSLIPPRLPKRSSNIRLAQCPRSAFVDRPEIELLLCGARSSMDPDSAEHIKILLQGDIDWTELRRIAGRHQVIPLVYRSLKTVCPEAVPKTTLTELRDYFQANTLRNLSLTQELLKLLKLFKSSELPILPFKGAVLAASAYGSLALRQFADLDLLVHPGDFSRAGDVLSSQGYCLGEVCDHEFSFVDPTGTVLVDLHRGITPHFFPSRLDFERLWEYQQPVSLHGIRVPSLSAEDMLTVLCVQLAMDRWANRTLLGKICDLAELLRTHPNLDWDRLMAQASRWKAQRMLFFGLGLARNLIQAPLPEVLAWKLETTPSINALVSRARRSLFQEPSRPYPDLFNRICFSFGVQERLPDKLAQFRLVGIKLGRQIERIGSALKPIFRRP